MVNDQFNIISAFAGNWLAAHRAACRLVESIDGVAIPQTAPLVIASAGGYPKDINFYQTIKLLSNALAACSPKGTLILLSRCHEGFGDDDCQKQIQAFSNMAERERALRDAFSIGAYVGFLFAEAAETHNLILVTDMNPDNFARTGIRAVKTLDEALKGGRNLERRFTRHENHSHAARGLHPAQTEGINDRKALTTIPRLNGTHVIRSASPPDNREA